MDFHQFTGRMNNHRDTDYPVSVSVIGLGVISSFYLQAISNSQAISLAAVCDLNPDKLAAFDKSVVTTTSIDQVLEMKDISSVIINLPNHIHFETCVKAIRRGKNVCCEKPLVIDQDDADFLVNYARENNVALFTAFHRRYNCNVNLLAARLKKNRGIKSIRARYFERIEEHCGESLWYLSKKECGGGVVVDNGPNLLDLMRHLFGEISIQSAQLSAFKNGVETRAIIYARTMENRPIELQLDWGYQFGEKKDVMVEYDNGDIDSADLLEGFPLFKSSLCHEYQFMLKDFLLHLKKSHSDEFKTEAMPDGAVITNLTNNIYKIGRRVRKINFE
jgi:L-arabinose 1-dehydrogenase